MQPPDRRRAPDRHGASALRPLRALVIGAAFAALGLRAEAARADETLSPSPPAESSAVAPAEAAPAPLTPAQKRAPYSLPWGLRPAIAPNLLRLDTAIAGADDGATVVSILTGGGKPISAVPDLGFYGRVAFAHHFGDADTSPALSNPLLGVLYTPELTKGLRLAPFAALSVPIGMGGGDDPDLGQRATLAAAGRARAGLDGVLFATNYLGAVGGLGAAYLTHGLTFQLEGTLVRAFRLRGGAVDGDETRSAATGGVHVGYLVLSLVNLSVEGRFQTWLSDAGPAVADPVAREQFSIAAGARFNVPLSDTILARPGLAWSTGLDAPMSDAAVHVVQVDLPFTF